MQGFEHGLLPKRGAAHVPSQRIHEHDDQDAFDGAVDDAQRESAGVVFLPGLDVKGLEGCWGYLLAATIV